MKQVNLSRQKLMSTAKRAKDPQAPRSIDSHLGELRNRLMWVVLSLIVMSAIAYSVNEFLVNLVLAPIGHQKLVYLTPAGGFAFIFQIIIYAGLLMTAPIMIYHLYRFVAPALPENIRSKSIRTVLLSTALMAFGASFGYFVAVPAALQFLTAFAGNFVEANLTADSYLNFVVAYVLGLGLLFQLPLLLQLWNGISPIKPGGLWQSQQYVLVGSFVAAALITPTPDVFNQSLIAVPIIAVYQIGVISVYLANRKKSARQQPSQDVLTVQQDVASQTIRHTPTYSPLTSAVAAPVNRVVAAPKVKKPQAVSVDGFVRSPQRLAAPYRGVPQRPTTLQRRLQQSPGRSVTSRSTSVDGFSFV